MLIPEQDSYEQNRTGCNLDIEDGETEVQNNSVTLR